MRRLLVASLALALVSFAACAGEDSNNNPLEGGGSGGIGGAGATGGTGAVGGTGGSGATGGTGGTGAVGGSGGTGGTGGEGEPPCTFDAGSIGGGGTGGTGGSGFDVPPACEECLTDALVACGEEDSGCQESLIEMGLCAMGAGCIGDAGIDYQCAVRACPTEAFAVGSCLARCDQLRECAGL